MSRGSRRRIAAAAAILIAIGAVLAAVALSSGSSPRAPSGTGVPAGETTTEVTRRTLSESSTVDGTLTYGGAMEVYDRLASAGTFTWLPAVGAVVGRGGRLFGVNEHPVVLMYGSVPAYRTLEEGVSDGADVRELNENLIDLGYDPYGAIAAGGDYSHFGEATAAAVRRWQKAEGLAQTGKLELGRVVFAPGAQRVTKVHVSLGQDPPGDPVYANGNAGEPAASEAGSSESGSKAPANGPDHEEPAPGSNGESAPGASGPTKTKPKSSKPEKSKPENSKHQKSSPKESSPRKSTPKASAPSESSFNDSSPKSPGSAGEGAGGGGAGGGGTVVLSTSSTEQIVQLKVKADQQQLAHVGESAPVTLPDGSVVQGHITEVGSVASESSEPERGGGGGENGGGSGGGGESATIPVTLALEHPVARLDEAPVSVELVKSVRRDVLAVPATALTATAGGGYAIETLGPGGSRVTVPVTPGMFADGYVQIEGPGVHEGLTVIESE